MTHSSTALSSSWYAWLSIAMTTTCNVNTPRTHRDMVIMGLVKVNTAQSRAFCPTSILDAFRKAGARPYSVNQILTQYTTSIDREMESNIIRNLERLARQIGHKGELFEKEYEDSVICDV